MISIPRLRVDRVVHERSWYLGVLHVAIGRGTRVSAVEHVGNVGVVVIRGIVATVVSIVHVGVVDVGVVVTVAVVGIGSVGSESVGSLFSEPHLPHCCFEVTSIPVYFVTLDMLVVLVERPCGVTQATLDRN